MSSFKPTYVWIDFICYNQHLFESIAPDMERVVGEIGRIGFAATPIPLLNRSWCLWELLCSERTGAVPQVFVHAGYRNDKILSVNALFRSFAGIEASASSSPRDQADIFNAFLGFFGSFEKADEHIENLIREKLSAPWFELHGREESLKFRPYPWLYDGGSDEAGRAVGIEKWRDFEPYYGDSLRGSLLFGSKASVYNRLIGAGLEASDRDKAAAELDNAGPMVLEAVGAAESGDTEALERLLAAGIDVESALWGASLLAIAAGEGQVDAMRVLVAHGVGINVMPAGGLPALTRAAKYGHVKAVEFLLNQGADPALATGDERRHTPLHEASLFGHVAVAARLLAAGAPVEARAVNDATPLHMAADQGHLAIVRMLLEHGAEIDAVNGDAGPRSSGPPAPATSRCSSSSSRPVPHRMWSRHG